MSCFRLPPSPSFAWRATPPELATSGARWASSCHVPVHLLRPHHFVETRQASSNEAAVVEEAPGFERGTITLTRPELANAAAWATCSEVTPAPGECSLRDGQSPVRTARRGCRRLSISPTKYRCRSRQRRPSAANRGEPGMTTGTTWARSRRSASAPIAAPRRDGLRGADAPRRARRSPSTSSTRPGRAGAAPISRSGQAVAHHPGRAAGHPPAGLRRRRRYTRPSDLVREHAVTMYFDRRVPGDESFPGNEP